MGYQKALRTQDFNDRKTDKVVQLNKIKLQQQDRLHVFCEDEVLENVFDFPYLGVKFTVDGDAIHDVNKRIAMALKRWGTSDKSSPQLIYR